MGHDDRLAGHFRLFFGAQFQVAVQLAQDVRDVRLALAHVVVGNRFKDLLVAVVDLREGALGLDVLLADEALDARDQRGIIEDHQVGVEDEGVLVADLGPDGVLDADKILAGADNGRPDALHLLVDPAGRYGFLALGEEDPSDQVGLAHGDAWRYADPAETDEVHRFILSRRTCYSGARPGPRRQQPRPGRSDG